MTIDKQLECLFVVSSIFYVFIILDTYIEYTDQPTGKDIMHGRMYNVNNITKKYNQLYIYKCILKRDDKQLRVYNTN